MFKECFDRLRREGALVHSITNHVTINDVANIILACGGSPTMAESAEDAADITTIAGGLNINMGNIDGINGMMIAGKKAAELGKPRVLDPVGAGASDIRTNIAKRLMDEITFTVIKGNASEIKSLIYGEGQTQGVDANDLDIVTEENLEENITLVKNFSKKTKSIIIMTGKIDLVTDGDSCYVIRNGREEMTLVTGTGCSLSGLLTAFLIANPNEPLVASAAATAAMGLAGEIGWSFMVKGDGNATYRNRIIDAIYNMSGEDLEKGAKYEIR